MSSKESCYKDVSHSSSKTQVLEQTANESTTCTENMVGSKHMEPNENIRLEKIVWLKRGRYNCLKTKKPKTKAQSMHMAIVRRA